MGRLAKDALTTRLLLVHYSWQSPAQVRSKVLNNWRGFGYSLKVNDVERMRPPFQNHHYQVPVLSILRGEPITVPPAFEMHTEFKKDVVSLRPLIEHVAGRAGGDASRTLSGSEGGSKLQAVQRMNGSSIPTTLAPLPPLCRCAMHMVDCPQSVQSGLLLEG